MSAAESSAIVRRLYEGVIATGRADQAEMVAGDYIQNSGWTPDGRALLRQRGSAISREAMPDGRALQVHMVAEHNRVASMSVWDGTLTSGDPADFFTLDFFRIEDGLIAEHWESVDWVRAYQSFGLLSPEVNDA